MIKPSSPGLTIASGRMGEVTKENGPILLIRKKAKDGVGVLVGIGVREGLSVRDGINVRVGVSVIVGVNVAVADKSGVYVWVGSGVYEDVIVSDGVDKSVGGFVGRNSEVSENELAGVGISKFVEIVSGNDVSIRGACPSQAEIENMRNARQIGIMCRFD
ncbi:MAG: hypothetical protein CVU41_09070 [Chloroflexi bacterium HGW-Chloroflexi-3]|nr:MAG: hypothetical protein CVU41_09070 [Chloroflexi bacterium HGW-Chloroflexi-3]